MNITMNGVTRPFIELVSDLAEQATYENLTEQMYTLSASERETAFTEQHIIEDENEDVCYSEEAQELFNYYYDYYSSLLETFFREDTKEV